MDRSPDSSAELIERANTALIRYPRFNELHRDIRECRQMSRMAGEPQCMALEGITGAGKSTLVKDYTAAFPRFETPTGTQIPIFYVETPSPATVKGLAATLLEQLGDPAAHRGTLWSMNSRLIHLVIACQVELVILDDFHHLIDLETNRILETVSEWLKVLIKETGVPFLVVGIEGRVEPILRTNPQLSRLFAVRETLRPFGWNGENSLREFHQFVQYAENAIGLPLASDDVPRRELLSRLHYATDGVVGHLMNLLRYAALLAQQQEHSSVGLADLARAFDKRLAKHQATKANPFGQAIGEHFVAPQPPPIGLPSAGGEKSQERNKRKPSTQQVLSAK